MLSIIKLINVHYRDERQCLKKVQFKTTFETPQNEKRYYIIENEEQREVSKDEGNERFKQIREHYPNARSLTIIDVNNEAINYCRVNDHYEVYLGGNFYCTCEDIKEVRREVEELQKC